MTNQAPLRRIIFSCIFIFSSAILFSQNQPFWSNSGNAVSANDKFGSNNNAAVTFVTNNVQRMQISAAGNIGMGTSPSSLYRLNMSGDLNIAGTIFAQGIVIATKLQADTVKGAVAFSVNNNLNITGGMLNELYTYAGDVRIQSHGPYSGNVLMCAGTNGNVGVGTSTPVYKFDMIGEARIAGKLLVDRIVGLPGDSILKIGDGTLFINYANGNIYQNNNIKGIGVGSNTAIAFGNCSVALGQGVVCNTVAANSVVIGHGVIGGGSLINTTSNSLMIGFNSNIPTLFVSQASGVGTTGAVCIGDTHIPNGYKLAVNGDILAEQVDLKLRGNWPDTVFAQGYDLMSLDDLAAYVHKEHHLPGLPSAAEVQAKGTYNVGQTEEVLLQKVEELTLYVTQLNAQIEEMKAQKAQ